MPYRYKKVKSYLMSRILDTINNHLLKRSITVMITHVIIYEHDEIKDESRLFCMARFGIAASIFL